MSNKLEPDPGFPEKKQIKVTALREGTVIDHLARGTALKAIHALGMEMTNTLLIGLDLESKKLGRKDLIKIENKELSQEEANKIALISPGATFSIIRDFKVVDKVSPELPDRVEGLIRCSNPSCVTNQYDLRTVFLVQKRDPVKVGCYFCERTFTKEEIVFK